MVCRAWLARVSTLTDAWSNSRVAGDAPRSVVLPCSRVRGALSRPGVWCRNEGLQMHDDEHEIRQLVAEFLPWTCEFAVAYNLRKRPRMKYRIALLGSKKVVPTGVSQ